MSAKKPQFTEAEVIRRLNALAGRWPEEYELFSWSGTLCLVKRSEVVVVVDGLYGFEKAVVATFDGIINDGGDPE